MSDPMSRRAWIASLTQSCAMVIALDALLPFRGHAVAAAFVVYKDPTCGCCTKWVAHLRASGFRPVVKDRRDMAALKDSLGVPMSLRSCHTAVAGRYVVEGHVPAQDVTRLLALAPREMIGIAVPDMPVGSPGMEMSGRSDHYEVVAFMANGTTKLFARH